MSAKRPSPPLPGLLVGVASLLVALHFLAIGVHVLAAPSGPWVTPMGIPSQAMGPKFAEKLDEAATTAYLQPLHMTHNYHFNGNRVDSPDVAFEVRLKDTEGQTIKTLKFPSPQANAWVRQRQRMLAQQLGDDEPVQPRGGEVIPAPGKKMRKVKFWAPVGDDLEMREVDENLVPKTGQVYGPREWSLIVARAYVRHLCREYGAASAEIARLSRQPVMPEMLFAQELPDETFKTLTSRFGEYRNEN